MYLYMIYILTIQNDEISCVHHVFDPLYVFFTPFGCLAEGKGLWSNLLLHFSKMKIFKTYVF